MQSHNPFEEFDKSRPTIKQRHGCLSAWLTLMLIGNSFSVLTYLLAGENINTVLNISVSKQLVLLMAFLSAGNVLFSVMLLRWKKIGFVGFVITSLVSVGINYSLGIGIFQSLLGLIGIAILFGVLQIPRNEKSGWQNLE